VGAFVTWLAIGQVGDNKPPGQATVAVASGDAWDGHTVTATACSVAPSGDGFQVNVSAILDGVGALTLNGRLNAQGPIPGVQAVFTRYDTGSFSQDDCTATFPRPEMGIAGGRVWVHVDCQNLKLASQNRTCSGLAELRFENCTGA
jgi:hypothetical protein